MSAQDSPLVCDATAVFNLGHRGSLDSLAERMRDERQLLVTPDVVKEVSQDDPAYYGSFLSRHFMINAEPLTALGKIAEASGDVSLDAGEISVISLCLQKGWTACLDETSARRVAKSLGLNLTGTFGLLKHAIEKRWLTDDECMQAVVRMKTGGFFCPKVLANDDFADYYARLRQN